MYYYIRQSSTLVYRQLRLSYLYGLGVEDITTLRRPKDQHWLDVRPKQVPTEQAHVQKFDSRPIGKRTIVTGVQGRQESSTTLDERRKRREKKIERIGVAVQVGLFGITT
ncbi:hypothetical protein N7517_001369 [Penicillium concentricum]|uniref:Uncharacterized protein n=1 Tax=Penicillium concentricum TaxID=293559 RepID=A0A9W9SVU8_9EURO|nr:uncharacterized protein N7517_001369 [Penicillium concentricum]KAJ5383458.1 hypothetical protein N7517_001369 [Penicillium concentricum]